MDQSKKLLGKFLILPILVFILFAGVFLFSKSADATLSYGLPVKFSTNTIDLNVNDRYDVCKLDDNHVLAVYSDQNDSNKGKVAVGTVTLDSTSWTSATIFDNTNNVSAVNVACLSSSKFVITYNVDEALNDPGKSIIGTVSNSTWNIDGLGSIVQFTNDVYLFDVDRLTDDKFVITFKDDENSEAGTAIIGDVSSYTITYGSKYVFDGGTYGIHHNSVAALDSTKFVIAFTGDYDDTDYSYAIIGTVAGNVITFGGNRVPYDQRNTVDSYHSVAALSSSTFAIGYEESNLMGNVIVGNLDGTYGIEFGNPTQVDSNKAQAPQVAKIDSSHIVVSYRDADSSYGYSRVGKIEGNGIVLNNPKVFSNTTMDREARVIVLDGQKLLSAYAKTETGIIPNGGYAVVGEYVPQTLDLGKIRSVIMDQLNKHSAVVSVHMGSRLDIHWQSPSGIIRIPGVLSGTNISLLGGVGAALDPLDSTQIYFGYTITSSPTEVHLVHYDLDDELILSNTTIASGANVNAAFARETYNNQPILLYAIGETAYIYRNGASASITGMSVIDGPMAVAYDGSNIHVAYQRADYDLMTGSFAASGSASITPVTIQSLDAPIMDIASAGFRNSALEAVYQTNNLAVNYASYDGVAFSATTLETLSINTSISAVELSDDSKVAAIYYDGANLVRQEITQATGASTKTVIQSGELYLSPTVNLSTSGDEIYAYGEEGDSADSLFVMASGDTPIQLDQQENGGSVIPELPTNIVWKIVIALMSMGAVIAIAAVTRKRSAAAIGAKSKKTGKSTAKPAKAPAVKKTAAKATGRRKKK